MYRFYFIVTPSYFPSLALSGLCGGGGACGSLAFAGARAAALLILVAVFAEGGGDARQHPPRIVADGLFGGHIVGLLIRRRKRLVVVVKFGAPVGDELFELVEREAAAEAKGRVDAVHAVGAYVRLVEDF
jgi:hypothetical protein